MNGIGAAGTAISRMIMASGAQNLICCDRFGVMDADDERLSWAQRELARDTNPEGVTGDLKEALKGADVFVGVSRAGLVSAEMVAGMAPGAIVFAMANPTPEIFPDEARAAGAAVVATGRSDFPNQINNCLGFPGIFRGALDAGAMRITEGMKLAAAQALAGLVSSEDLSADYVIPSALDDRVVRSMAKAVAAKAREEGVCRS
jgi:malate dehydrogenase (oxaloacetate-decarboxylating)